MASLKYKQRNKVDPFYLETILGGIKKGKSYLALSDLYGNYFEADYQVTSFARYLCPTIIEKEHSPDMDLEQARELMIKCFKIIYAKFKLAGQNVEMAFVSNQGV